MSDTKGTPVYRYEVADYLNLAAAGASTPDYKLLNVMDTVDENPNAQTSEKHYTADKSATTLTTGYKPQFPIKGDMYAENAVMEWLRDIGEEQKLGVETDYVRVRLYEPIQGKDNTFYARRFLVSPEISTVSGAGGEIMSISGNLNTIGDVVIGEFNTETRTFKSLADVAADTIQNA